MISTLFRSLCLCRAFFQVFPAGGHCFPDHNGAGFGHIGYADALRFSSNTFFYHVGVGVGSLALKKAADQLGFQQKTGIEIGWEENIGLVGDETWAAEGRGWAKPGSTPWIPEDMASASIGQSSRWCRSRRCNWRGPTPFLQTVVGS